MGGIVKLITGLFTGEMFETPSMPAVPPMPAIPGQSVEEVAAATKREAESLALQKRQVATAEAEQKALEGQLAEQKKQGEITKRETVAGEMKQKKEEEALAVDAKRRALLAMRGNQTLLTGGLGATGKATLLTKTLGA